MNIYIFDLEVFAYDWIAVFRNPESQHYTVIHNNNYQLRAFMEQPDIVIGGFNNKSYDDYIMLTMLKGGSNVEVKRHNDFIIKEKRKGWEFPFIQYQKKPFYSFDLRDDIADQNISLKAIEGNLKLPIVESSVPFDIDRPLTSEELEEVIRYCKRDVDSTIALYYERKANYIDAKALVAEMYNIPMKEALGLTNAKLSARVLGAKRVERNDERNYIIPDNINLDLIPKIVLDFFMQIHDESIPDTKLFGDGKKEGMTLELWFTTSAGKCPIKFAWGGLHGAKPCVTVETTGEVIIVNQDVGSLYPNSMINFGYCSRSMKDPNAYVELVKKRLGYKHAGDKVKADALKLVVNTVYGAMLNLFNDLADRWAGRSVCISNQLAMTMLIVLLAKECETIDFVNINTDGIMFTINKRELEKSEIIIAAWCEMTKFEMERDDFVKVIQKDVNNYIGIKEDGSFKTKGGYVSLYKGGNFKTNSLAVIDKAVVEYLVHSVKPETTINNEKDIFNFQQIVKTGGTFEGSFQYVNGKRVSLQKVNRIYAVKDPKYGQVVKGKWITEKRRKNKATGKMEVQKVDPPVWSESNVPECPEHAFVDNENVLTVNDLDKQYYIDMAYRRIDKYINIDRKVVNKLNKIKEEIVIMTTKKEETTPQKDLSFLNIWQKLSIARGKFLDAPVKKSGINRFAEYKYFELADIVPPATAIFNELGLLFYVTFDKDYAYGHLINSDKPEEMITFTSPMADLEVKGMNAVQALGGTETYQRRYLYMVCLDIVEADAFDATQGKPDPQTGKAETAKKSNRPATQEQREETKKELINEGGAATNVQITSIKNGLKKLREKDGDYEPYIKEVAKKIKAGINKADAEAVLIEIGEKIEEA